MNPVKPMPQTPFKLRLDESLHRQLKLVSELSHTSMNRVILRALEAELPILCSILESDLKKTLARLRELSDRDPHSQQAIEAFVRAEVEEDDPLEGTPVDLATPSEAQREFRELLSRG